MRALHLVKTSVGGRWALRQMRELVEAGVEIHATIPPGGPLRGEYSSAGVRLHEGQFDLPVRAPWRWPGLFGRIRSIVASVRPDVIHSHFVGTTIAARLALGRRHHIPRVFQVPGPLHLEHSFFRRAEIATAGRSDRWIASCEWTRQTYRESGIPAKRVFLSYYGTDLGNFIERPRGRLRTEIRAAQDTCVVGMVAYMYAPKRYLGQRRGLKGHEDFIRAIAVLLADEPNLRGVVIGGAWDDPTYEAELRRMGSRLCGERLVFLGHRNNIPELYPDIDVAVHPSLSENVGGAVESLLCGVPTVATRVGGLPDLVRHGETGFLVPPRSPQRLAAAILEMIRESRTRPRDGSARPGACPEFVRRSAHRARSLRDLPAHPRGELALWAAFSRNAHLI